MDNGPPRVPEMLVTLAHHGRPDDTEQKHREYLQWLDQAGVGWPDWLLQLNPSFAKCQSYIERLYLANLAQMRHESEPVSYEEATSFLLNDEAPAKGLLVVTPQPGIALPGRTLHPDFRVELTLLAPGSPSAALFVECDGHDYHNARKEQVTRDRRRDRAILSEGYNAIRFTGSEIWADGFSCARETVRILRQLAEREAA